MALGQCCICCEISMFQELGLCLALAAFFSSQRMAGLDSSVFY